MCWGLIDVRLWWRNIRRRRMRLFHASAGEAHARHGVRNLIRSARTKLWLGHLRIAGRDMRDGMRSRHRVRLLLLLLLLEVLWWRNNASWSNRCVSVITSGFSGIGIGEVLVALRGSDRVLRVVRGRGGDGVAKLGRHGCGKAVATISTRCWTHRTCF